MNVTRFCIWQGRNAVKFDNANFDFSLYFDAIIRERVQVEFFIAKHLKHNIQEFETLWAQNNDLCSVNDSALFQLL